jgi:hypothetical protein
MRLLALALLAALQGAPDELDVVHLKNGGMRQGRIVSETAADLVLETFIKGSKGEVVGSAKVTLAKSEIDRVVRASAEARKKAEERSTAFAARGLRRAELLAKFKPQPTSFEGHLGLEVAGTHFHLLSTCDANFVKDLAASLEELFGAYGRFFEVRRNADRKIKVYVLSDVEEYRRFTERRYQGSVAAIAFYHPKDNTVVAYNLIQKAEERKARAEISQANADLERYRGDLTTTQRRIDQIALDLRKQIQAQAGELRRQIRLDGGAQKEERLREVDRREREVLAELKDGKAAAQKELADEKKKANDAMELCRRVIDHNEKTLAGQNRLMYETVFHEGFHAFASNFLWEGSGEKEFPRWLHEGMACYFEMSVVENGALLHGAPHPALLKLLKEKQVLRALLPVDKILRGGADVFSLSHPSEADRRSTYYAQSWLLAHYLSSRVQPADLAAYVTDVLAGQDRVAAFEKRTGRKLPQLQAELEIHLDSLK